MREYPDKYARELACRHKLRNCAARVLEARTEWAETGENVWLDLRDEARDDGQYWMAELNKVKQP